MANHTDKEKLNELEKPEFLERLRNYDQEAFHILVESLRSRIYNLAIRLTRNPDDAEEILQETFLAVFDKIHTFQGKSRLSTWIYAIASNAALSRIRKNSGQAVTFSGEDALNIDQSLLRNKTTLFDINRDDPVLQKELMERLNEAIDSLPEGYREIFLLKEIEHLPIKDIAEIFQINPGAIKTRLHRARLYLRARLSDYWNGGEL